MATPVYTPRVNNNDDTVQVIALHVSPGDEIKRGDLLAEVETDKSVMEVEAEIDGFVLELRYEIDAAADVGSVLLWIGGTPDEPIPKLPGDADSDMPEGGPGRPTAKALAMLRRYGLTPNQVPSSSERLNAAEVSAYATKKGLDTKKRVTQTGREDKKPEVSGKFVELTTVEQGMLRTVTWHRDQAAGAYLEIEYDSKTWDQAAADYATRHGLMLSPMLPMMAYRLVQLAVDQTKLNSTIVASKRYEYTQVNLGFTVQAGEILYLTVMQNAGGMDIQTFIQSLGELQRHAMGHKLKPEESQGATLAFSSMSRWGVSRHMPILPPNTSLVVAHAATKADGKAVLGATYDHRALSGYDVVRLLAALAEPPDREGGPAP